MDLRLSAAAITAVMALVGCGGDSDGRSGSAAQATSTAASPVRTGPSATNPKILIEDTRDDGGIFGRDGTRFRMDGRTWRLCGVDVTVTEGAGYRDVAVSGQRDCRAATNVIVALADRVAERSEAGEDCFPGYCTASKPAPTTVAGHRCTATQDPELDSIWLFVACMRGDGGVSVTAFDES